MGRMGCIGVEGNVSVSEPFDPGAFLDQVTMELVEAAPDDVKNSIVFDDALRGEILAFQALARDGLWAAVRRTGTPEALEADLRAAKSRIVAKAQRHAFTIERLVSSAITRIVAKAREVGA